MVDSHGYGNLPLQQYNRDRLQASESSPQAGTVTTVCYCVCVCVCTCVLPYLFSCCCILLVCSSLEMNCLLFTQSHTGRNLCRIACTHSFCDLRVLPLAVYVLEFSGCLSDVAAGIVGVSIQTWSSPVVHAVGNRQDHLGSPVCCHAGLPCGDSGYVPGGCSACSRVY